jgi:Ca2+-binding RTX toxin-like protein
VLFRSNFHHLRSLATVDLLVYTTNASTIVETAGGNDEIIAGSGNDEITTGAGNDVIDPGTGRDRVFAGAGDDAIYLTRGDKYYDGGAGSDTLRLSASFGTTPIHVDLSRNLYFFPSLAEAEDGFDKRFFLMENVEVLSTGTVTLIGDANANRLTGGGGNDAINGGDGYDVAGYAGARKNYGTVNSTTVVGGREGGTDTLTGIEAAAFVDGLMTFNADSQAAQPMVFTITFLLVAIIALLNIAAIWLRSRLRRRYASQTF